MVWMMLYHSNELSEVAYSLLDLLKNDKVFSQFYTSEYQHNSIRPRRLSTDEISNGNEWSDSDVESEFSDDNITQDNLYLDVIELSQKRKHSDFDEQ